MRDIHVSAIIDAVKKLCIDANLELEPDMLRAFDRALTSERSAAGKQVLQILKDNAEMAKTRRIPYCQDTGFVVCFVGLGQDVHVTGGGLDDAINEGVRQGYREGYLRASIVRSPFDRVNTGDNTPAVIHVDIVAGATLRLMIMAKGGGCENRSKYTMLTPAEGAAGVKDWIIECVRTAGPDACPPLIVGVGVGGTFEKAAILSKRALVVDGRFVADYAESRLDARRVGTGAAGARQPPRHRAAGLRRRHHRARDPHRHVPLPHHVAPGRGDDRMPRPSAQRTHALTGAVGERGGGGGAGTTRRACAAPGWLGSIWGRLVRRRFSGTGPRTPSAAPPADRDRADLGQSFGTGIEQLAGLGGERG